MTQLAVANLRPFKAGPDPRRNMGGPLSKAEKEWREALENEHIPRASELLRKMIDQGIAGDDRSALVAFKVMGLIRKATSDEEAQALARKIVDAMLEEARARRAAGG